MSLQLVDTFHNPFRSGNETDTPSGHCISFGYTVDDDNAVFDFSELSDALVLADVVDVFINFVGNNDDTFMFSQNCSQSDQFFL